MLFVAKSSVTKLLLYFSFVWNAAISASAIVASSEFCSIYNLLSTKVQPHNTRAEEVTLASSEMLHRFQDYTFDL